MQNARRNEMSRPWEGYAELLGDLKARETAASVDGDLVGHEDRVARSTRDLATAAGVEPSEVERMTVAARFHDIGKLKIDTAILRKPGRYEQHERDVMERHAEFGADILSAIPGVDPMMLDAARHHHERFDGKGYAGLAGEDIPLVARIVAIADVHDALVSKRDYKKALPESEVLAMMTGDDAHPNTGRDAFDPGLLRAFVALRLADPEFNQREEHRLARSFAEDPRPALAAFAASPVPSAPAVPGRR